MHRLIVAFAAALGLAPAGAVLAAGPVLPLAAPPAGGSPTASSIFDALLAISRTATTNPRAAQNASFSYASAIQAYNAGDLDRARANAIQAIVQTDAPSQIQPHGSPAAYSKADYAQMPPVASTGQSDMEADLDLARHALLTCGPTDGPTFVAVRPIYDAAVANELAGQDRQLHTNVQTILDRCATAGASATAATPAP